MSEKNSAVQKSQGRREKRGMLSIYTVLLNCHLLFRLTRKLALEMEFLTASLQIEVCLSQKWWDSLSRVAASLSSALWQGEREWLEQKPLLAEVLLFIPWYKNVYSGEAQSSAIEKAQSGASAPTLTSPGNFWMLGSPNLKMLLLFAPSILLLQLSLLDAATSWSDVLLSFALSSTC